MSLLIRPGRPGCDRGAENPSRVSENRIGRTPRTFPTLVTDGCVSGTAHNVYIGSAQQHQSGLGPGCDDRSITSALPAFLNTAVRGPHLDVSRAVVQSVKNNHPVLAQESAKFEIFRELAGSFPVHPEHSRSGPEALSGWRPREVPGTGQEPPIDVESLQQIVRLGDRDDDHMTASCVRNRQCSWSDADGQARLIRRNRQPPDNIGGLADQPRNVNRPKPLPCGSRNIRYQCTGEKHGKVMGPLHAPIIPSDGDRGCGADNPGDNRVSKRLGRY